MENIEARLEGTKLILEIEMNESAGETAAGNAKVAFVNGFQSLEKVEGLEKLAGHSLSLMIVRKKNTPQFSEKKKTVSKKSKPETAKKFVKKTPKKTIDEDDDNLPA